MAKIHWFFLHTHTQTQIPDFSIGNGRVKNWEHHHCFLFAMVLKESSEAVPLILESKWGSIGPINVQNLQRTASVLTVLIRAFSFQGAKKKWVQLFFQSWSLSVAVTLSQTNPPNRIIVIIKGGKSNARLPEHLGWNTKCVWEFELHQFFQVHSKQNET